MQAKHMTITLTSGHKTLVLGGTIAYLDDLERLRERLARFLSPHEEG